MKSPASLSYITNGKQIIKLGIRYPNECAGRRKPGFHYYGCKGYPHLFVGSFARETIYSDWFGAGNFMSKFWPIKKSLIHPRIIKELSE